MKVIAGDLKEGDWGVAAGGEGSTAVFTKGFFTADVMGEILQVETINEHNQASVGKALGFGVAGGVLAGPVGAAVGAVIGSRQTTTVVAAVEVSTGEKFVAEMSNEEYTKLLITKRNGEGHRQFMADMEEMRKKYES